MRAAVNRGNGCEWEDNSWGLYHSSLHGDPAHRKPWQHQNTGAAQICAG